MRHWNVFREVSQYQRIGFSASNVVVRLRHEGNMMLVRKNGYCLFSARGRDGIGFSRLTPYLNVARIDMGRFFSHNSTAETTEGEKVANGTALSAYSKSLAKGLLDGNRVSLSRSITLIESTLDEHKIEAQKLLEHVLAVRKSRIVEKGSKWKTSFRLGIAGPPGAGKSSFIEVLGTKLVTEMGMRVAVLTIDPSSTITGGSILGDKTRMNNLARLSNAYVRPSPTRGSLGGVAEHTNDVILLCEAAGFDFVIVETVGVGQSEVLVDETVDMLMLMVSPAGGDELQGVKKGIMEHCDLVVVNKSDGDLEGPARHAATDIMHSLQLIRRKYPSWRPRVKRVSTLNGSGIEEVWDIVMKFRTSMEESGDIEKKRQRQNRGWMWSQFNQQLVSCARNNSNVQEMAEQLQKDLALGLSTPRQAARVLVKKFVGNDD